MNKLLILSFLAFLSFSAFGVEKTTSFTSEKGRKYTIDCPPSKAGLIGDINRYARKHDGFTVDYISMMKTGTISIRMVKVISEDEQDIKIIDVPNFEGCLLINEYKYKR